jgi:signal transduction histidine kinase
MVFRDVTERRRVELERAALLEREQEARRQAEQALIQLHGIQAVTDIALANLDLTVLMRELLTRVRDILEADTASILFIEPDGKHLKPAASDGLHEEIGGQARIPLGRGAAGQIAESEHGLIFNDIADIEVVSPFLRNYVKSLAGVPLRVSGELVGVLHVGSVVHRRFGSDDLHLLSLVAERIALAIERARLHDAERRSKAEAERANRLKDEFLAVLSHELRTPLTSILGWAHVLKSREIRPERTGHAVQAIERGAQAAANLVNSLLDLSRIISGQLHLEMRPLDLVSTITAAVDTIRPVAEAKSLTVEVIVPPTPIILTGDANRLEQVVLNLLSNAVKFTPDHGRIQVRLRQVESSAEIEVNDTGRGIRPEFLPHVFDRFVQAESSESRVGIGLGLAIVRELVQGHGGNIHAASAGEGQGSTFTVRLPLMPVTARLPL